MVACHGGAGPALHRLCLVNGVWPGFFAVIDPQGHGACSFKHRKGGAGRYRNIISQEYASVPLLWWSWDFRIEECRVDRRRYLSKLDASRCTRIVRRNMRPGVTLLRNPNFKDRLFITAILQCSCKLQERKEQPSPINGSFLLTFSQREPSWSPKISALCVPTPLPQKKRIWS